MLGRKVPIAFCDVEVRLDLWSLTEVFNRAKRANSGIEEGNQVHHEDVVQEQVTVPMRALFTQRREYFFERSDILCSNDLLRPFFRRRIRTRRVCGRLRDVLSLLRGR